MGRADVGGSSSSPSLPPPPPPAVGVEGRVEDVLMSVDERPILMEEELWPAERELERRLMV